MPRTAINFLGYGKIFMAVSAVLLTVSIGSLAFMGLSLGIEFQGGTVANIAPVDGVTMTDMREAFADAGVPDVQLQSTDDGGFIVRTSESDPDDANHVFNEVSAALGITDEVGSVTTIGPGWGRNVSNAALLALALSIAAILLYISLRFEYKMSLTAVAALVHDIIIVLGLYALSGRDVTPNTIAALLTIMGYSLYDTVVVFHRMKENSARLTKQTFTQMANTSLNQVIVRTLNTSMTSLIPVGALFFFGGDTLKDFAFALLIGLLIGTYSSVGVASPIYVAWKEREPRYAALRKRLARA